MNNGAGCVEVKKWREKTVWGTVLAIFSVSGALDTARVTDTMKGWGDRENKYIRQLVLLK
jgi:hypothetical protein